MEPIAIIGIGCRFPGAPNPEAFWQLVRDGGDAITQVPADRWNIDTFYDPDPDIPGKMSTRWGGFLDQIDQFDAAFFKISPQEAAQIDPQQRLLLEVAWEALEDAGQQIPRLAGSPTGVFIGLMYCDYLAIAQNDLCLVTAHTGTGNAFSIAANRLSYVFDFHGPSLAIDTACSSSLVAIHQACISLQSGECNMALAGGVNVLLAPLNTIFFTKAQLTAPDGRCKAFDARANGIVRSDGVGAVVLKRLQDALADGDPIRAVIRGTSVNHDGRTNGITAPNRWAQEAVLREAYRQAQVSPGQVQYIEAHGTGTPLGDPIEAAALGTVLAVDRAPGNRCIIGSVKTNIGHLETAAGIAGLIKVVLSLQHKQIPPSLHFQQPNPYIPFDKLPLTVAQSLLPWPEHTGPALAGVSAFGFGGANAHVVVEEFPAQPSSEPRDTGGPYLLTLSARSPEALRDMAQVYSYYLTHEGTGNSLDDICYTAGARRTHHEYRMAVTSYTREELGHLDAFLKSEPAASLSVGHSVPGRQCKLVFVFSGQGSQWTGMGLELAAQEPVFRKALQHCQEAMRPYVDWSLLEELAADQAHSRLDETDFMQPAIFAIQVSLAALWRSWGIEPDAVVGHSMGEIAAAHVAGALSLEQATQIICRRSQLMKRKSGQGAVAVVGLGVEPVQQFLIGYQDRLSIAASNSPTSTVLSGDPAALEELSEQLRQQNIFCRKVNMDVAVHSHQMDSVRTELVESLGNLELGITLVPLYSTVTGQCSDELVLDANYWGQNLRQPVLFSETVQQLLEDDYGVFLEIAPHSILSTAIEQRVQYAGRKAVVLSSLHKKEPEQLGLFKSLGALYTLGYSIDWSSFYPAGGQCVPLPPYPWQHQHYWLVSTRRARGDLFAQKALDSEIHPLLGHKLALALNETVFEVCLSSQSPSFVGDHKVYEMVVLPGAAYPEIGLAAANHVFGQGIKTIKDLSIQEALILPEGASRTVQIVLSPASSGQSFFQVLSRGNDQDSWTLHASGTILIEPELAAPKDEPISIEQLQNQLQKGMTSEEHYQRYLERGMQYDARFRGVKKLWRQSGESLGLVQVPQGLALETGAYQMHPAVLDACFQIGAAGLSSELADSDSIAYIPIAIDRFQLYRSPGKQMWSHAILRPSKTLNQEILTVDMNVYDESGYVIAKIDGLHVKRAPRAALARVARHRLSDWLYEVEWQPKTYQPAQAAIVEQTRNHGVWLIFADQGGLGAALAQLLAKRGQSVVMVLPGQAYEILEETHYIINPTRPDDVRQLLKDVLERNLSPLCKIIFLWSLDIGEEKLTIPALEFQAHSCGSILHTVQALIHNKQPESPQLWLVTRNAQPVDTQPQPINIAQSPLWGLGRVLALEHPDLWGGLIDLDASPSTDDAVRLLMEAEETNGEDQVTFRAGERYVARLVHSSLPEPKSLNLRADGTYLITGGLGALGLQCAQWLVERGAQHLVLIGRTELPQRAEWECYVQQHNDKRAKQITKLLELEALGAKVQALAADVGDPAQMSPLLEQLRRPGLELRGIVHAAGVSAFQDLQDTQLDMLHNVFHPKALGAWVLHQLTRDMSLDFFILFSSAAAIWGSKGLGVYAAANHFLDALAHHRRALGLPGLSVNWARLSEPGMISPEGQDFLSRIGVEPVPIEQAWEILGYLVQANTTQKTVAAVDWGTFRPIYEAKKRRPILEHLKPSLKIQAKPPLTTKHEIVRQLESALPGQRQELLIEHIRGQVAQVLGFDSPQQLDPQRGFFELGMDSIMAVQIKKRLEISLGRSLPTTLAFDYPTIEALAAYLQQEMLSQELPEPQAETQPAKPLEQVAQLKELEQLSEDELVALLAQELETHRKANG